MTASFRYAARNLGRRRTRTLLGALGIFLTLSLLTAIQIGIDSISVSYTDLVALQAGGMAVTLLDKGRGPGGRMSTRRVTTALGEASFDHGAQYFTVRDPDFARCVEQWRAKGVAARWPAAGDDAWVGTPASTDSQH